ncbi:hypothetical protein MTO96_039164 [Rhipicephalus appendiculatus]
MRPLLPLLELGAVSVECAAVPPWFHKNHPFAIMALFNLIYIRHRLVQYRRVGQDVDHFVLTKPDLLQLQICHSYWYCLIASWYFQGRNRSQPVYIRAISLDNL